MFIKKTEPAQSTAQNPVVVHQAETVKEHLTATSEHITSLVAEGVRIQGDMVLEKGIRIDGTIVGNVEVTGIGSIYVSPGGFVEGNIFAKKLLLSGKVKGNISCNTVLVAASAQVDGDIEYSVLKIATGASINGHVSLKQPAQDVQSQHPELLVVTG
ncbi:MAG: polymer-forming cytoskeletal protein [Pseudomonadota bacterium]|nr:polymer-forming cytoskeletal protein [Pseudomonadota bacterium]